MTKAVLFSLECQGTFSKGIFHDPSPKIIVSVLSQILKMHMKKGYH